MVTSRSAPRSHQAPGRDFQCHTLYHYFRSIDPCCALRPTCLQTTDIPAPVPGLQKQEQAEREYRRNKLLARVRGAEELQRESGGLVRVDEQDAEPLTRDGDDRGDGRFDLGLGKEHINLFGLSDARNGPDEAVAEAKREEARRRGREDQRTSDARFDAQFRLGRQLGQDEPWWVDGGMALQARRELDAARRDAEARQRQAASASGGPLAVGAVAESDLRMERARREREEARRER